MKIELLRHHVRSSRPWRDFGVFDGWKDFGLHPTMKDVQHYVVPRLKHVTDGEGKPVYSFLTKNLEQRHRFIKRWLECYKAYLSDDYVEIPDYDPNTKMANKDHLCDACPNWDELCRMKKINPELESWQPHVFV